MDSDSDLRAIEQPEDKLGALMSQNFLGVYIIQDNVIKYANKAMTNFFGYSLDEVVGKKSPLDFIAPEDREKVRKNLKARLEGNEDKLEYNFTAIKKDGSRIEVQVSGSTVEYQGKPAVMGMMRDMTEVNRTFEKMQYLAYHDQSLEIPNRQYFYDALEKYLNGTLPSSGRFAVLMMAVDGIHEINQAYGHRIGDSVLESLAHQLQDCLEGYNDNAELCRWTYDRLAILYPMQSENDDLTTVAESLLETFEDPIRLNGTPLYVSGNIGIARFPDDAEFTEQLVSCAETALASTEKLGQNTHATYTSGQTRSMRQELRLTRDLRTAIHEEEFVLRYLPSFDLKRGVMSGMEALVRWDHPELGMLQPNVFIPLAENSGLIIDLDKLVIRHAFEDLLGLNNEPNPLKLSVNLSVRHFLREGLLEYLHKILETRNINPAQLQFEVTEHVLMKDVDRAVETLEQIKQMGATVAVDDFGTGFSSFQYLADLPVDVLKIDRTFVNSIGEDTDEGAIVSILCDIGHRLGLEIVAEGVETVEQLQYLSKLDCDRVQGFLLSTPVPRERIASLQGVSLEQLLSRKDQEGYAERSA